MTRDEASRVIAALIAKHQSEIESIRRMRLKPEAKADLVSEEERKISALEIAFRDVTRAMVLEEPAEAVS